MKRSGKLITTSLVVMAIGVAFFLLGFPLYAYFGIDTDVIGLAVLATGLAILLLGIVRRKNMHGWKLMVLTILAIVLCLPVLTLILSLLYYLVTGRAMGA